MSAVGVIFVAWLVVHFVRHIAESRGMQEGIFGLLLWAALAPVWIDLWAVLRDGGVWAVLPLVGLSAVLLPWITSRFVLVPLGLVKPAYVFGRLSVIRWYGDAMGAALVAASLAAIRRGDDDSWAWIETQRDDGRPPLRTGAVLATGLALAQRGQLDAARDALSVFEWVAPEAATAPARRMALEWLAAEASERGAWDEAAYWGLHPRGATLGGRFLGWVGARFGGAPEASNTRLWLSWLGSGRPRALRPLLDRARSTPCGAPSPATPEPDEVPPTGTARDEALWRHARALQHPEHLDLDELVALATAWDRALGPELHRILGARGAELPELHRASDRLRRTVEDDLLELVERSGVSLSAAGHAPNTCLLLESVVEQVRGRLLDALELSARALGERVEAERDLPPAAECLEWLAVRRTYDEVHRRAGEEARALAFEIIHHPVCALSVRLFNERDEKIVSNAISRWLLAEATAVGDAEAMRLQRENVDCGWR